MSRQEAPLAALPGITSIHGFDSRIFKFRFYFRPRPRRLAALPGATSICGFRFSKLQISILRFGRVRAALVFVREKSRVYYKYIARSLAFARSSSRIYVRVCVCA